jgi:hypothetical protein
MKRVLFLYFSQAGQTERAIRLLAQGFSEVHPCEVVAYRVAEAFPFPWRMTRFFRVFPRCVLGLAPALEPLGVDLAQFDLIVLGGQVWFLSPSLPLHSFLQSPEARAMKGKSVVMLMTCRNLWVSAAKIVRSCFVGLGVRFLGQITVCEISPLWASFVTTPRWMLSGKKTPFAFFPAAGIREQDFAQLAEKGRQMATHWMRQQSVPEELLSSNLDRPSLRMMEAIGRRVFEGWARLIQRVAPHAGLWQDFFLILFRIHLVTLIVFAAPCT